MGGQLEDYMVTRPTISEQFDSLDARLIRIETQLTEMHEIFCKLYLAYEAMSSSPMFAALVGRLGK